MKKKIITSLVIVLGVLAVGALVYSGIKIKQEQKELDKHLIALDYNSLKEKIDNKDSFILVVTGSKCSHCTEYKPILKRVLKNHDLYAYEIENDKLNKEELAYLNSIAMVDGTPTTIFIVDGSEYSAMNRIVGKVNADKLESRLKAVGYIE